MSQYAYRASELGPYRVDPLDHYGLAVAVARSSPCPSHLTRDDLVQEALTVLCAAARTYDPALGYAFSTWATRLIRNHLSDVYAWYHRMGSLGGRNHRCLSRSLRSYLKGVDPSSNPTVIRSLLQENRHWSGATDYDCGLVMQVALHGEESLDDTWNHREGEDSPGAKIPRHETVEDPGLLQDIEDGVRAREIERAVCAVVGRLRPREREVTVLRILPDLMGAGEDAPTLQDVADKWGVTRQRVQQIESDAMGKLRRMLSRA